MANKFVCAVQHPTNNEQGGTGLGEPGHLKAAIVEAQTISPEHMPLSFSS